MAITAEGLLRRSTTLHSLPMIYEQLDREINNPLSNLEDIANIFLDDSALSARLLRLTNSAMYNFPSKVDTINRAITIIGTRQLRDLAFSTSVLSLFDGIDPQLIEMESFWRHSIAVGVAARVIATYLYEKDVERYYLMGLLHDIGRLIMYTHIPDTMSQLIVQCKEQQQLLHLQEEQELGFHHGDVGRLLLQSWKLPAPTCDAVGFHHHPQRSTAYQRELAIIHIADLLANALQLGNSNGLSQVSPLNTTSWELIGLPTALLPDMLDHVVAQYDDVVNILLS